MDDSPEFRASAFSKRGASLPVAAPVDEKDSHSTKTGFPLDENVLVMRLAFAPPTTTEFPLDKIVVVLHVVASRDHLA